jgi:hypothetical protein
MATGSGVQHAQSLLRDLQIINERTVRELGPLPTGGMPVAVKRKPNLPARVLATQVPAAATTAVAETVRLEGRAVDDIPTDPEGAEMFILGKLSKKRVPREPWPLRFDSFSFGARCYHTQRCVVVFSRKHQVPEMDQVGPSGEPHAPDWKEHWHASHSISAENVFPSPVEIRWTAMDGVARTTTIDLETIFPERLILHNAREDEIVGAWGLNDHARHVEILLEVNDRTINLYMRGWVALKQRRDPADHMSDDLRDLMLAWTKTY